MSEHVDAEDRELTEDEAIEVVMGLFDWCAPTPSADAAALRSRDWGNEPAGEEMDRAIHQFIASRNVGERPSTDLRDAMAILGVATGIIFTDEARVRSVTLEFGTDAAWSCRLSGEEWWSEGEGETPELALCRALLHFKDDDDEPDAPLFPPLSADEKAQAREAQRARDDQQRAEHYAYIKAFRREERGWESSPSALYRAALARGLDSDAAMAYAFEQLAAESAAKAKRD